MSNEFSNCTALVTGGAGGIGRAICKALAVEGAKVIIGDRRKDAIDAVAAEIGMAAGTLCGDFSDVADCEKLLEAAGPIDILVSCCGDTDTPPGFDTPEQDWDRLIRSNLSGPAALARIAARAMKVRGYGTILFIGSICGQEILGAPIAYNVGKTGLRALTKTMAHELGPHGVRVNMISPGNVIFPGGRWEAKLAANADAIRLMLESKVPLRRFGSPQDIAEAVLFLCSSRAAFVTGVNLPIDGGQTVAV